jgi:hypothetical protein
MKGQRKPERAGEVEEAGQERQERNESNRGKDAEEEG